MVEQGAEQRVLQPQEEERQKCPEGGAVEGGSEAKGGPRRTGRRTNSEWAAELGKLQKEGRRGDRAEEHQEVVGKEEEEVQTRGVKNLSW